MCGVRCCESDTLASCCREVVAVAKEAGFARSAAACPHARVLICAAEAACTDEGRGDAEWEERGTDLLVDRPLVFELRCVSRRVEMCAAGEW